VAVATDPMHLLVVIAGIGIGAWALIALRRSLPRGRFVVFAIASVGALFGCAALAGEVGFFPPAIWFTIVMAMMFGALIFGYRLGRRSLAWR
jgi:hypothetical protein